MWAGVPDMFRRGQLFWPLAVVFVVTPLCHKPWLTEQWLCRLKVFSDEAATVGEQ